MLWLPQGLMDRNFSSSPNFKLECGTISVSRGNYKIKEELVAYFIMEKLLEKKALHLNLLLTVSRDQMRFFNPTSLLDRTQI